MEYEQILFFVIFKRFSVDAANALKAFANFIPLIVT